ncbi:MarR family transcriptional regulator [Microbacteriaceae bacterium K1510]|nr:MarR family transcriptional regulator [Microbacteriaceae bacterium K1510]
MQSEDLQSKPAHLIRRANQISAALFMEECAAFDLTILQYMALLTIRDHAGTDATRLCSFVSSDRATMVGLLERLEVRKLIRRFPDPDDKRVKLLKVTAAGAQLIDRAETAVSRAQMRILEPLRPNDRKRFLTLLGQIVAPKRLPRLDRSGIKPPSRIST